MAPQTTGPRTALDGPDTRRHLTVLFSDLCGSTGLGQRVDPETLDEVLQYVREAAFAVVSSHDGTVVQFHGDGVLAVFGYPEPHEDDVRRAGEAALELHARIRSLDLAHLLPPDYAPRMHSGIEAGLVLVRGGDAVFGRLTLVGDPPNTAAGLANRAGADEILATRTAFEGSLPFFETDLVDEVASKGDARAIDAYRVLGRTDVTTRFEASRRRGLTPFIGREVPLARLQAALDAATAGHLERVSLVGDAGLGKTRLVEEFLGRQRAAGTRILTAYCEQQGGIAPLAPFAGLIREALAIGHDPTAEVSAAAVEAGLAERGLAAQAVEILGLLGLEPAPRTDTAGEGSAAPRAQGGAAALLAFGALLARLASEGPLIVFVDDWQWSDDASRLADGELARGLRDHPILWITASRPTHTTATIREDETRIALDPFDTNDSARAIEALAAGGLDLGLAERLQRRSGGNPLYLEELCRSVEGLPRSELASLDVPATLQGLLEARVHALPPDESRLLRAAAVIGNVVPTWLLEEVAGLRETNEALASLAAKSLLQASGVPGTLRFQHGITRDVVYHSVRLGDRRKLHADIAAEIERRYAGRAGERPLETLAYHYEGAADFERAADLAEAAGDRAWATSALDRARDQYGAALAALDQLEETGDRQRRWLEISKRRAFACVFQPAAEQIEMLARAAEIGERLGEPSAVGHAHFWSGFISYSLGEFDDATTLYRRGIEVADRARDEKLSAQLRANLGENHAAACEYDAALPLLDDSLAAKRRLQSGDSKGKIPTGSAYALACRGFIDAECGRREAGEEMIALSLEAVEGTGHPVGGSCLAIQSATSVLYGRFQQTLELAPVVQSLGQRMNGPFLFGRGQSDLAFAQFMTTGDVDALERLSSAADWLEQRGIRLYLSISDGCAAEALVRAGRYERARRHAERALARADRLDRVGEGMACRAMAQIVARESPNQPERADAYHDRARAAARAHAARGGARRARAHGARVVRGGGASAPGFPGVDLSAARRIRRREGTPRARPPRRFQRSRRSRRDAGTGGSRKARARA